MAERIAGHTHKKEQAVKNIKILTKNNKFSEHRHEHVIE